MSTQRRHRNKRGKAKTTERIVTGTVDKLVASGAGLVRTDQGVVFVRGGLPGERVEARVAQKKGGVGHGDVLRVLEPSADRVEADCPAHPACGGCDLLHMAAHARGAAKATIVNDALARIAKLDESELARVHPMAEAPVHSGARRRTRFQIAADGKPAFFQRGSHTLITPPVCTALAAPLAAVWDALHKAADMPAGLEIQLSMDARDHVGAAVSGGRPRERMLAKGKLLDAGCTGVLVMDGERVADEAGEWLLEGEIAGHVAGGPYLHDAATFSQATSHGALTIDSRVVDAALPLEGAAVTELFAGAGHITFALTERGADVMAIEGAPRSVRWLEQNAVRANAALPGTAKTMRAMITGDDPAFLARLPKKTDVLIADPPRRGIDNIAAIVERLSPARIVMVSCDVATGARDIRRVLDLGYHFDGLWPMDAFPRTSHIEWVARLSRVDNPT